MHDVAVQVAVQVAVHLAVSLYPEIFIPKVKLLYELQHGLLLDVSITMHLTILRIYFDLQFLESGKNENRKLI